MEQSYNYKLIKRAIELIDAAPAPLALSDLAGEMNLSPAHFQRLFSKWVGVSPKVYQQYLMLDHSKHLLQDRFTTLDVSGELGLSGTSRLYDLYLKWEAMTPGEFASGAEGMQIFYGYCLSPFGEVLIMATSRGICGMAFCEDEGRDAAFADMASRWPAAEFVEDTAVIAPIAHGIFEGTGNQTLHLIGAPFQIKVWQALLEIPSGHVTTYSEIANRIGSPKAVRAVGTAIGKNPISWLIPCHRALRKSGELGGYHWGLPVKRAMLAFEAGQAEDHRGKA
jgi:AraC family transcriptional regulator of adaptative response/methylated-DNA-[protein]-cysteine methyltransferase